MSSAPPRPAVARRLRPRGVGSSALLAGALAVGLSGCGANFQAQTYQERPTTDGTNTAVGAIAIRNVAILPGSDRTVPAGSDADVRLTLTNDGGEDDRLVSASSPAAASVDLVETRTGQTVSSIVLPRLGTTGSTAGLVLRSVSKQLRSGESVPLTLRFQRNGEVTFDVPVALTGTYESGRPKSRNFQEPGESGEQPSPGTGSGTTGGNG